MNEIIRCRKVKNKDESNAYSESLFILNDLRDKSVRIQNQLSEQDQEIERLKLDLMILEKEDDEVEEVLDEEKERRQELDDCTEILEDENEKSEKYKRENYELETKHHLGNSMTTYHSTSKRTARAPKVDYLAWNKSKRNNAWLDKPWNVHNSGVGGLSFSRRLDEKSNDSGYHGVNSSDDLGYYNACSVDNDNDRDCRYNDSDRPNMLSPVQKLAPQTDEIEEILGGMQEELKELRIKGQMIKGDLLDRIKLLDTDMNKMN